MDTLNTQHVATKWSLLMLRNNGVLCSRFESISGYNSRGPSMFYSDTPGINRKLEHNCSLFSELCSVNWVHAAIYILKVVIIYIYT
jgi:hypothetical protein